MRIMARLLGERKGLFGANLGLRLVKDLLPFLGPILVGMTVDLLSGASGRDRNLLGIELTQNDVRSIVIVAAFMAWLAVAKTAVGVYPHHHCRPYGPPCRASSPPRSSRSCHADVTR